MQQQIPNNTGVVKDEISLKEMILKVKDLLRSLIKKWKIITSITIIGGVIGLIYALLLPVSYIAQTSFVLQTQKDNSDYSSIAAKFGLSVGGGGQGLFSDDDNMIIFIKSRKMLVQTLLTSADFNGKKELLINRYLNIKSYRKKWKRIELKEIQFKEYPSKNSLLADSILFQVHKELLKKHIRVEKPDPSGDLITLTINSIDELFSKAFNEKLLDNVTNFYSVTVTKKSQQNVDILQNQVDSIHFLLNNALLSTATSIDYTINLNPAYQRLKTTSQKGIVEIEMNKAILEELVKNLELAKISLRRQTPLIQTIDLPQLPLEKKKIGKLVGILLGSLIGFSLSVLGIIVIVFYKKIMS